MGGQVGGIPNLAQNNYIVTFEYRVMVTAFAILAMFLLSERSYSGERVGCDACPRTTEM